VGIIRLLLAAAVVLGHSSAINGLTLGGGVLAVNCFFVISGFYMAMVLEQKYLRLPKHRWATFMTSRFLRLMPVYVTVCLATLAVIVKLGARQPFGHLSDLSPLSIVLVIASNVTLIGQDVMLFLGVTPGSGNFHFTSNFWAEHNAGYRYMLIPPAWSVSLELGFYALAPWLARVRIRWTALALVASVTLRHLLDQAGYSQDPWSYRFFFTAIAYFLTGMLAYRYAKLPVVQRRISSRLRRWGPVAALAAAVAMLVFAQNGQAMTASYTFYAPYFFALLVPSIFSLTRKNRWDRWTGDLSYPLYLVHVLVMVVLGAKAIATPGYVLLPTAIAAAAVLLVVVDRPVERYRQRRLEALTRREGIDQSPRSRSPSVPEKERV
jgi:peptidoglycan/LPS O-acetylase OafA/YrhL